MSINEILAAVEKLSPPDKLRVIEALSRSSPIDQTDDVIERQAEHHRQLIAQGRLKGIPDPNVPRREFKPIKIKGKPLSETIIEDRR